MNRLFKLSIHVEWNGPTGTCSGHGVFVCGWDGGGGGGGGGEAMLRALNVIIPISRVEYLHIV